VVAFRVCHSYRRGRRDDACWIAQAQNTITIVRNLPPIQSSHSTPLRSLSVALRSRCGAARRGVMRDWRWYRGSRSFRFRGCRLCRVFLCVAVPQIGCYANLGG